MRTTLKRRRIFSLASGLGFGLVLTLALLWSLDAQAHFGMLAPAAELHVCPAGPPACGYTSIQDAVDAAAASTVIKVAAGAYTDMHSQQSAPGYNGPATITQLVYISKTVTIQGGYTVGNWSTPDPVANATTLDAQGQGRVFFITDASITPVVQGLRITGGNAIGLGGLSGGMHAGGGVYLDAATAVISDNLVYSNTAGSNGSGGGLCLINSKAVLDGNTVRNNTADNGDGLYLYASSATLSHNTIRDNGDTVSGWGGGLYLAYSDARLSHNTITGNRGGYGGGVNVQAGAATLNDNTITGNIGYRGGGLYLYAGAAALNNNVVTGNIASDQGGGVYFWRDTSVLVNTVVTDNILDGSGGLGAGIYADGASAPRLLHATIARNSGGDGVGVYVTNWATGQFSTVTMTNTIIAGHPAAGVSVKAGNTATLEATLWHDNAAHWGGAGTIHHTRDYYGDPSFAADGYHLAATSAAIDRGVAAGVTTDIDGNARPQNAGYDLGADEFVGTPVTAREIRLPLVVRER